jgi:hypothetical protein
MLRRPTRTEWRSAEEAIRKYGGARTRFRKVQTELRNCGLLQGNDNKVGAAGEFWAIKYYCSRGYRIIEVPKSNNAGYDFRCAKHGSRVLRVSVTVVTKESVSGTQLPLKKSDKWDVLFVVLLTTRLAPYKRGLATRSQLRRAIRDHRIGETPKIARSSLNEKGWITRYGTTENWN